MESGLFDANGNWTVEPPKGREQTKKEGGDLNMLVEHSLELTDNEEVYELIAFKYNLDYESEEEWPIRYSTVFRIIDKAID